MIQEQIEQIFSKTNRDNIVLGELLTSDWYIEKHMQSCYLFKNYLEKEHTTEEKQARVNKIHQEYLDFEDIEKLVNSIFVTTCQVYANIPLVSVSAMLAPKFSFLPIEDAILSMAEILSILSEVDLYDLYIARNKQVAMRSRVKLDEEVIKELNTLMYLPPMISPPRIIEKNRDHYHYSLKEESMILGGHFNHHNGEIGLDVLNTLSQQELLIDMEFVKNNTPVKPEGTVQKDWDSYMEQSNYVYSILADNIIYIPFKVDKRGRVYAQGHHVNSQGDDYHKAAIELANKEYVDIGEL